MILPTTIEPSTPEFSAIWRIGDSSAFNTMLMPAWTSELSLWMRPTAFLARSSATPPPGTMPSWTAARGGVGAGSRRSLLCLAPRRVAPPPPRPRAPAGQFRKTLLQLLAVVVRGGFLDLRLDLRDAG